LTTDWLGGLRCCIKDCRTPLGKNGRSGFKGERGYIGHLVNKHKNENPANCAEVNRPRCVDKGNNDNHNRIYHVPHAAAKINVQFDVPAEFTAEGVIPYLPDAPPQPAVSPASARLRQSAPSAADLKFAAAVDVSKVLRTNFLKILPFRHRAASALYSKALILIFKLISDTSNGVPTIAGVHLWELFNRLILSTAPDASLSATMVNRRLQRFISGDWRNLLQEYLNLHCAERERVRRHLSKKRSPPGSRRGPSPPRQASLEASLTQQEWAVARTVRQAVKNMKAGNYRCGRVELERALVLSMLQERVSAPPRLQEMAELESVKVKAMQDAQVPLAFPLSTEAIQTFVPSVRGMTVSDKGLAAAVRGMALKKAGGPNGMCSDHVNDLVLDDPDLLKALGDVVGRLFDGTLPAVLMRRLLICNLFAVVQNQQDPTKKTKIRPITCEDWLLRVSARYAFNQARCDILKACEPVQLGGSRAGCDVAVHALQFFGAAHPGLAVVQADQEAAFPNMSREKALQLFMANPKLQRLVPFLRQLYINESELILSLNRTTGSYKLLYSVEGTKQGAPESSHVFNMVSLNALNALINELKDPGGVDNDPLVELLVAFADDTTIICDPTDVLRTLELLATNIAKVGGKINYGKTKVYLRDGVLPTDILLRVNLKPGDQNAIDDRLPTVQRGIVQLGVPYGHPDFVEAWWESHLEQQKIFLSFVSDHCKGELQSALTFLRLCVHPRMVYLSRCLPPTSTVPYLRRFDNMMATCVAELIGVDPAQLAPDALPRLQMQLPIKLGGLGLASTAVIAPSAFTASVLDCMPLLKLLGAKRGAASVGSDTWLASECTKLLRLLDVQPDSAPDSLVLPATPIGASPLVASFLEAARLLPAVSLEILRLHLVDNNPMTALPTSDSTDEDTGEELRKNNLQRQLTAPVYEAAEAHYKQRMMEENHSERLAQHLSQRSTGPTGGPGWLGTSWLNVRHRAAEINAATMRTGLLIYLGLEDRSIAAAPPRCLCGCTLGPQVQATFLHFWSCPKSLDVNRSGGASIHHRFGLAFDAIYHQLGAASIKDEQQGVPTANHRMDKVIRQVECLAGLAIFQDHTLSNPCCDSYLGQAITTPLHAANQAHDDKLAKYQPHVNPTTAMLFPVAVEIYGGTHNSVVQQLSKFAAEVAKSKGKTAGKHLGIWRRWLSITLLRQRCYLYQELLERAVTGHDSITNSKRRHGHFDTFPYQQLRNSAALGFGG